MLTERWYWHAWSNRIQTALLILALLGVSALAGYLLAGPDGFWMAVAASTVALLVEPATARLTLRLYGAQPISLGAAPGLGRLVGEIATRAELASVPGLYYIPSPVINAFTVGNRRQSAIALTHGLLEKLPMRELAAVLAHETAHIANGDLRVMGLADYVSRLTNLFSLIGQFMILFSLPTLLSGGGRINWAGFMLLVFSPHLALLSQLGLSRVREFEADLKAAALTGDPQGLASALEHIEGSQRSWRSVLMPGWGNPGPSWLRTHPETEERIRRLLELVPPPDAERLVREDNAMRHGFLRDSLRRRPRWTIGGLWH